MSDVADEVEEAQLEQELAADEHGDSGRSIYVKGAILMTVLVVGYFAYRRYSSE